MIPYLVSAELVKEGLWWMVFFVDPNGLRFPMMKLVPVSETPASCPGGEMWCKQFNCDSKLNVFTAAEPVVLQEGLETVKYSASEECYEDGLGEVCDFDLCDPYDCVIHD